MLRRSRFHNGHRSAERIDRRLPCSDLQRRAWTQSDLDRKERFPRKRGWPKSCALETFPLPQNGMFLKWVRSISGLQTAGRWAGNAEFISLSLNLTMCPRDSLRVDRKST